MITCVSTTCTLPDFLFFSESFSFSGCLTLFLVILSIQISLAIDFFHLGSLLYKLKCWVDLTYNLSRASNLSKVNRNCMLWHGSSVTTSQTGERAHIVPSRRRVPRKIVRIKKKRLEESDRQDKIHDDLWGTCFLLCHKHYQKHIKMPKA